MPSVTPNLRLSITERETNKPFLNWRLGIDGPDDSNMTKLDTAWGDMKTMVDGAMAAVGHANTASTVAQMTDHTKAYVYTGSETGYTAGNWYYWDDTQSAWVSGGVYNATALETDETLTLEGEAADAKATGEMIVVNDDSSDGTRINITTTNEDVEIPTMGDISDISSAIDLVYNSVGAHAYDVTGNDQYIKLTGTTADPDHPTTYAGSAYIIADCSPGDVFTFSAEGAANGRAYGILDASNNVLKRAPATTTYNNEIIQIPENGVKIIINSNPSDPVLYKNIIPTRQISGDETISLPWSITDTGKAISWSNGQEISSGVYGVTGYVDISNCREITYSRIGISVSVSSGMAFYDENYTYISGLISSSEYPVSQYFDQTLEVPPRARYARFTVWPDPAAHGPFEVSGVNYNAWDIIKRNNDNITELLSAENGEMIYNIPWYMAACGKMITYNTGAVSNSSVYAITDYVDVSAYDEITYRRIKLEISVMSGMAFYDTNKAYISGSGIQSIINSDATEYVDYTVAVPSGAKYARFTLWPNTEHGDFWIHATIRNQWDSINLMNSTDDEFDPTTVKKEAEHMGLHTMPENPGVLNAIKKARQFTDIEWTPAVDLPRVCKIMGNIGSQDGKTYQDVFKAGTKYKGVPYSNTSSYGNGGYPQKYIGYDVDFETFVTAIENAHSVISEESYYRENPYYHATIYGSVCSSMVSYAIGLNSFVSTSGLESVSGMKVLGNLVSEGVRFDPQDIKLADILNKPNDHTVIITDIIKDYLGNVIYFEVSEETVSGSGNQDAAGGPVGGIARRKGFSVDDFYDYFALYHVLRYNYIAKNTYTPSKYVNSGAEFDMLRYDKLPVLPYMGENAKYNSGSLLGYKLLLNCNDYGYLKIFKNDVEISGSPFNVTGITEYTPTETGVGSYTAYLCNIVNNVMTISTLPCHWTITT